MLLAPNNKSKNKSQTKSVTQALRVDSYLCFNMYGKQEAGSRKQEAGSRKQEAGIGKAQKIIYRLVFFRDAGG